MTSLALRGVDCHLHVYDSRYPFIESPRYVPHVSQIGTARQFTEVLKSHGLSHALLVAAAPYGGNNGPVLDAIRESGGRYKGVALLPDPEVSDRTLEEMGAGGIVGIRVNLALGLQEIEGRTAERLLHRMAEIGWFLDIHCEGDDLAHALPLLRRTRVKLLVDHCGRPDPALGLEQPGFRTLLELAREERSHVKLSGPFRFSRAPAPHEDVDPFVRAVVQAYGVQRCVWGSDWPFVNVPERIDYGPQLACLERWLPDAADREAVLRSTPARLFGFALEREAAVHS